MCMEITIRNLGSQRLFPISSRGGGGDITFRAEKCIRATQTFENRKNHEKRENREKSQKSRKTRKSQKSQNLRTYVCRDVKSTRLRV